VQFGHLVAFRFIAVKQNGHGFVETASFFLKAFIALIIKNKTSARIKKLMIVFINNP
jgi:hypothetical protein